MSSSFDVQIRQGQVFANRYVVADVLGKGGMGAVYRARDTALGEDVALKVLAPLSGSSAIALQRFRQEVKLSRRVTHQNVVRVYDIGEVDGMLYMTMELVHGHTLLHRVRTEKRLPAEEVARIGAGICAGLSVAHAAGIVHRDLKPANVMLEQGGRVVLTDFGIARSLTEDSEFTQEGMLVGTLKYMAPEQISRKPVIDARTDIYTLGLVLYEALTGELPDRAGGSNNPLEHGVKGPVEVLAKLSKLLQMCIEPNPAARPQSAEEVGRLLEEIAKVQSIDEELATNEIEVVKETHTISGRIATEIHTSNAPRTTLTELSSRFSLAVLPFHFQGPADHTYLGSTVADELVDMLVQIRGFRVIGTATTQSFVQNRDPRSIGKTLEVAMVLDGSLQMASGGRVRTTVRLFNAATGAQLWSEKHDGTISDVFSFQIAIARKIAERLRVEVSVLSYQGDASPEAIGHYLSGRRYFRVSEPELVLRAAQEFEQCVSLAPRFLPAIAKQALATVRCWFFDQGISRDIDWKSLAEERVARAFSEAPDLAETHLAAAMMAVQRCRFDEARRALDRALAIAPMCLDALEYAGMLECEAGHVESGIERLEIARDLDATRYFASVQLARTHALLGDDEKADGLLAEAAKRSAGASFAVVMVTARKAAWRRDVSRLQLGDLSGSLSSPRWATIKLILGVLWGQVDMEDIEQEGPKLISSSMGPRAQTAAYVILADLWSLLGQTERALMCITYASRLGLLDVLWLERCPLLDPLRNQPAFIDAMHRAKVTAESMRP